eukprot:TRINITY_DN162_c2_g1_i3.p1 TRINITY_DN162_c2_g1~~TRINITY_DN162_c2_g1_i3.p1  ORF type:complete len:571 (+),score=316.56 TRINITY_DN162_c2_g1_i3:63-1775(+)
MNPNAKPFIPNFKPTTNNQVPQNQPKVTNIQPTQPKQQSQPQPQPQSKQQPQPQPVIQQTQENKNINTNVNPVPIVQSETQIEVNSTTSTSNSTTSTSASSSSSSSTNSTTSTSTSNPNPISQDNFDEESLLGEEEEEDPREHVNVVFIGHVDAGKSTIAGNILFLTGMVDKRTVEKYEREAKEKNRSTWFLSYIMDTNEEERAKGKTVEVGRSYFSTSRKRYTILDAPGHKNYVPNMIGGASQADVGILVISAKGGEFESGFDRGGQTREHAMLVKTLGIKQLVVVINKMDEPSVEWSKQRYDEILDKLGNYLRKECMFAPKDLAFLPISGYSGYNLVEKIPESICPWFEGKSLLQTLDELESTSRCDSGFVRIPITDRYKDMGSVNILGKIESGTISRDQILTVMPNKVQVRVSAVFADDKKVKRAKSGENIRVVVQGIEETDISTGFVICEPNSLIPIVTEFEAQLIILELLPTTPLFTAGYEAVLHIHNCIRECSVLQLLKEIDRKTKKPFRKPPTFVKNGAIVFTRLRISIPACIETFSAFAQLGRFTLRDKGKTVAIGKVTTIC